MKGNSHKPYVTNFHSRKSVLCWRWLSQWRTSNFGNLWFIAPSFPETPLKKDRSPPNTARNYIIGCQKWCSAQYLLKYESLVVRRMARLRGEARPSSVSTSRCAAQKVRMYHMRPNTDLILTNYPQTVVEEDSCKTPATILRKFYAADVQNILRYLRKAAI